MAQHDMNIANQGFPATRADLNNALQALVSNSSGATAPSTTFANQWWYDTTNNKMYLRNEANNAWIEVFTLDQTNNEWQLVTGQISAADGDGIAFKTDDGITRLTLDDSGNLLMATTDSSLFNQSTETGLVYEADAALTVARSGGDPLALNRLSTDGGIVLLQKDGASVASIGTQNGQPYFAHDNGSSDVGILLGNSGTTARAIIPCRDGGTIPDGSIDIGYASGRWKDLYLSSGAYIGGTAAANKIGDFETGTWTPTSNTGTVTFNDATYTKVGRMVTLYVANLRFSNFTSSDVIQIESLPFAPNSSLSGGVGACMAAWRDDSTGIVAYVPSNVTVIRLYHSSTTSSFTALSHNMFNNASHTIYFTVSYEA